MSRALDPGLAAALAPRLRSLAAKAGAHALSDYSFANLYLFRRAHDYRYLDGDWPGIAGRSYDGQRHFLPLFDPARAPAEVLGAFLARHECFFPLDAGCADGLVSRGLALASRRNDADYLYPLAQFLGYPGRALRNKRLQLQQARRFSLALQPLDTPDGRRAAHQVLARWMKARDLGAGAADQRPCEEAIEQGSALGLTGWVLRADGEPAAFALAEPLVDATWVVRFAKGDDAVPGVYAALFEALATQLAGRARWLNFEQDLGHPGFRQAKLAYRPACLLPKYRLSANRSTLTQDGPAGGA